MKVTYGGRWCFDDGTSIESFLARPLLDKLRGEVGRYQNKRFLKAAMAVCALTALADSDIELADRRRVNRAIRSAPSLAQFNIDKASQILDGYITELECNRETATAILYDKVRRVTGNFKLARTLMRVSYLIITAEHVVSDKEMTEFQRLCEVLELEPDEVWRNAVIWNKFHSARLD